MDEREMHKRTMTSPRVALVTGSARGIGRAIADSLASAGHQVVGVDLLEHHGPPFVATHRADLSDPQECQRLIDAVGPIDVLVNNAAVLIRKPIPEYTLADFDTMVAVNLRAPFLLSRGLIGGMTARGWGRIINIASVGGRTGGLSLTAVYAATKGGLIALTKGFARDYGATGVNVNAIAPGGIEAPMAAVQGPAEREKFLSQIPLHRYAAPSEVGSVVAFLASDGSSFVNGATIHVDGGWVMV
jgi:NAD(P)-dependent dehydrogenase (short-subunit alcohol dehydrogenase family)